MVHPCSLELYTRSGEDLGLVNDDGGEPMRIFKWRHPQHGPSVFGIVKGHTLHDSRQLFKVLSLLQLHVVHSGYLLPKFPAQRPRKNLRSQIGTVAGGVSGRSRDSKVARTFSD